MKNYIVHDPWKIIEEGFHPVYNKITESLCSLGNGQMGQRGNFEEDYSGESLQGNYVAGVYYPDKTRVGWWKNGYPEYFAKVLNAANWIGIPIQLNGHSLDLAKAEIKSFKRVLDMQSGVLNRDCKGTIKGIDFHLTSERFCSIVEDELGAIKYSITVDQDTQVQFAPFIDFDVVNEDSNYDEKFWIHQASLQRDGASILSASTKKTDFHVASGMINIVSVNGKEVEVSSKVSEREKFIDEAFSIELKAGDTLTINKYACNLSSRNHKKEALLESAFSLLQNAKTKGYESLKADQIKAWRAKWDEMDIQIEGDVAAQQGIRFNIFQLYQTYTGEDDRLNIGPKGFTGEKYGGSTYWDTEAYCLPFYLATSPPKVAKNLLLYRYKQLDKAIENAEKLGFTNGAALYPMVTMNGEECHNEWEITFEEIHRNGAIAYAVYNYINYTGDTSYLASNGLEVLIAISRFWAQRVNFSPAKQKYVMLGVTGPNEYENNINNNWYTNYIAVWTLKYTLEAIEYVKQNSPKELDRIYAKISFSGDTEISSWMDVIEKMYYPYDEGKQIFLQQDNYLDKVPDTVADLKEEDRPLNQKWSWDRILRSPFIKQADTLQGFYLFEDDFDLATIQRHFDFYEPRTVHESSLSPCIHSVLAAKLGMKEKAYEMYLRTARLDLDDYNNDTEDGCHITSMAGTWMAIVEGFGGMRVKNGKLHLSPFVPDNWEAYSFKINFDGVILRIRVSSAGTVVENESEKSLEIILHGNPATIHPNTKLEV